MLMDPSVSQVDCQIQNTGEKPSPPTFDRKHTLPHEWQGSGIEQTNSVISSDPVEPNKSSRVSINNKLDGSTSEKSSASLDNLHERQDGPTKPKNGEDPCFKDVKFQLTGRTQNNGSLHEHDSSNKLTVSRGDANHGRNDLYLPSYSQHNESGSSSSFQHDIAITVVSRYPESNGDVPFSQDKKTMEEGHAVIDAHDKEGITDVPSSDVAVTELNGLPESNGDASSPQDKKNKEKIKEDAAVDAQSKEVGADMSGSHAVQEELHCTLQDLSEIACRIDLVRGKSSSQEENETSFLPKNDMNQLAHNDSCNGDNKYKGEELDPSGNVGQDHAIAFWVKWRGKWQTGIRCSREDCPLSTLKAKPTHERKSYIVVFFPRTRTYSWVDMLLVRPIDEYPVPLVNGTHRKWRKLVKDLSLPRRYIMQKLAISMLHFSDELHVEAIIKNARKVATWKEFAREASSCRDYADLGKMLMKLHNTILPGFISCNWLQHSFDLWNQRCKDAHYAETIEILTEELRQSVLWNKVDEFWNAPVQPEVAPEWKTWKQDVMKQFFASHPAGSSGNMESKNCYDDPGMELQTSRKSPKLEVRRGETYFSQMGDTDCRILSEDHNRNSLSGNSIIHEIVGPLQTKDCSNTVSITSNFNGQEIIESGHANSPLQNVKSDLDSFKASRQCSAFIEAKGRQCGRWANDGDIYCCVHQSMHFVDQSSKEEKALPVETPMCSGMTNLGRKCKHRAQHGSIFCKKHRFQTSLDAMSSANLLSSSEVSLMRDDSAKKVAEKFARSNAICNIDSGWTGNSQVAVQEKLVSSVAGEISDDKPHGVENTDMCNALSTSLATTNVDMPHCIGFRYQENIVECQDYARQHTLYCEKHLPKFLKRARNGKSRLISKDVFLNLLKSCSSRKQKISLHQACEFLYWFLRSNLSRQRSLHGDYMPQILAEVSKNPDVGEYLLKLVSSEREKLANIWGFGTDRSKQGYSTNREGSVMIMHEKGTNPSFGLKCKICAREFSDDHSLGLHWTDVHKREARWLFKGYACAICMDSFTNRKVLERHVQEKHGVQFLQCSTLFRCMSCDSHFVNPDQLWQHIVSYHAKEFRLLDVPQRPRSQSVRKPEGTCNNSHYNNDNFEKDDGSQKFTCRFCGLRFDLLPDLGRHHQVAHMNPGAMSHFSPGRGKYQLNRSRHYYSSFKKGLRPSGALKKRSGFGIEKHFKIPSSDLSRTTSQTAEAEAVSLGKLLDFQCADVAEVLFSKIQKSRPHPSNLDIVSIARSACCRTNLLSVLEVKYGTLPENFYVKAAKLCSDVGIQVDWHQQGFICPKGCKASTNSYLLPPLQPIPVDFPKAPASVMDPPNDVEMWDMEECHYVLDSKHFGWKPKNEKVVLCEDISFGREKVPIICVIDVNTKDSLDITPDELQQLGISVPWQGFHYVTECLVDTSLVDLENSLPGCACSQDQCSPEKCDHVNIFVSAYENAVDIHGKPMHGRFAYDERGRIILQEGYPIYECNSLCNCDASCQNKVLQKGLVVELELFRTESKGWAVRAAEPIPCGTFVCEYVGEVVKDDKTKRNAQREANNGCSYLFDINSHIDKATAQTIGASTYMIDATRYGNVSRFMNHSCSPNLVPHLVLVESKDCQLGHVGLFASQDIAMGEELAYDYRQKLLDSDGCPCHCSAENCRGRVY